jgi:hypothetical protein
MKRYPWYSITGWILKGCVRIIRNSGNASLILLSAVVYALFDIYGLRNAPRVLVLLIYQLRKEMQQWPAKK